MPLRAWISGDDLLGPWYITHVIAATVNSTWSLRVILVARTDRHDPSRPVLVGLFLDLEDDRQESVSGWVMDMSSDSSRRRSTTPWTRHGITTYEFLLAML